VKPKPEKRKKKRIEFATVDFPADFEIQAKKVMPVTSKDFPDDNLDEWWGRANLKIETQSEYFKGKVHLRMYPGEFGDKVLSVKRDANDSLITTSQTRDRIEIYEAWAWHRGDYFNFKIGRWSNTTRFGSETFGGYLDAKKDVNFSPGKTLDGLGKENMRRQAGFMSTYDPENSVQFGFHNFAENISLDLSLISMDKHLNKGDLRINLRFEDLANVSGLNAGLGYRSNLFDEIYSKYGDVTHTIALGGSIPLVANVGFLKNMNLFVETALIGLDDQFGTVPDLPGATPAICPATTEATIEISKDCRSDSGKKTDASQKPILLGLELDLYRSFDKVVVEAEFDGSRKKPEQALLYSIYVKKQLNDRFTINLGMQSETSAPAKGKDFSFAGRLQGRIN
jgi:hypothetical protein